MQLTTLTAGLTMLQVIDYLRAFRRSPSLRVTQCPRRVGKCPGKNYNHRTPQNFLWMSTDGQGTKCRRNIAENVNRLSMVHERYRQTDDRQTDGR